MGSSDYQQLSDPSTTGAALTGDNGKESVAENMEGFNRVLGTPPQRKEKGKKRGLDDLKEKEGLSEQPIKKRRCRPKVADDKFSLKPRKAKVKISKPVKVKRAGSKKVGLNKRKYVRKKKDLPDAAVRPPEAEGGEAVVSGETLLDSAKGEELKGSCRRALEFIDDHPMFVSSPLNSDNEMGVGISSLFLGENKVQDTFSTQLAETSIGTTSAQGKFSDNETSKAVEPAFFEEGKLSNSEAGEGSVSCDRLLNLPEKRESRGLCGETLDFQEVNAIPTVDISKSDAEIEPKASESLWLDSWRKDTSALVVYVRKKKRQVSFNIQSNMGVFPEQPSSEEVTVKPNEPSGGNFCSVQLQTSASEEYTRESSRNALDLQVENAMSSVAISRTNKKMTCTVSSSNLKNKDRLDLLYNPLVANGRMMRNCQCIQLLRKCKPNVLKTRKKPRMVRKRRVDICLLISSFHTPKHVRSIKPVLPYQDWSIPIRKQRSKGVIRRRRRDFLPLMPPPRFNKIAGSPIEQRCMVEIPKTDIWPTHDNLVTISKGASLPQEKQVFVESQEIDLNEEPQHRGFDLLFTNNEHLFASDTGDELGCASHTYVSNQWDSAFERGIDYSIVSAVNPQAVHVNHHSLVPWTNIPVHSYVHITDSCYPYQNSSSLQTDISVDTGADFHITYQPPLWGTTYNNINLPSPTNEQEPVPEARGYFLTINDPNYQKLYYNNSLVPHFEEGSTTYIDNYSVNTNVLVPYSEPSTLLHGQELVTRVDTSLDVISDIGNLELVISRKKKKVTPHVKFDSRTIPMFNALMGYDSGNQCNEDEESKKWWREERRVMEDKVHAFISCMHKIQGNRRFSRWKGSVLDSVMGVYLTQNVSDHLSSSAYMSLAAKYPVDPSYTQKAAQEENECVVGASQESCGSNETVVVPTSELSDQEVLIERLMDDEQIAQLQNSIRTLSINEVAGNNQTEDDHAIPEVGLKGFEEWLSLREQMIQPQDSSHPNFEMKECLTQQEQTHKPHDSSLTYAETVECLSQQGQTTHPQDCSQPESETEVLLSLQQEQTTQPHDSSHPKSETEALLSNQQEQTTTQHQDSSHLKSETEMKIPGPKVQKNKPPPIDWLATKRKYCNEKRERHKDHTDSVDWDAVRKAPIEELSDTIKKRGQHNILAVSMQKALNRIYSELGSLDLEWLRDTPPLIAKDFLESIRGIGLKSVECIRLLALEQVAFPVDVNVGRIAVRLGWVDLKDVPPGLQFHLIEQYPMMDAIQKYLWPRLCELDQPTLYELHYQMITFGKVFCKKRSPYCNACPLRASCKYFASAYVSAQLSITGGANSGVLQSPPLIGDKGTQLQTINDGHIVKMLASPESHPEMPTSQESHIEMPTSLEPHIEMPTSPEPHIETPTSPKCEHEDELEDIEDLYKDEPEIPHIILNDEEFKANVNKYLGDRTLQMGAETSNALVLSAEAARIPVRKLKDIKDLRTEHLVYEIPDSHPLLHLHELDERDPDDQCFYLLSILGPDESATWSMQTKESNSNCGGDAEKCSSRLDDEDYVLGTFMIPCRTAMKGRFPLNGTYFQVNEVFADDESSHRPVKVPRSFLWDLDRRIVYCGSSTSSITTGLTTWEIQQCFWKEYMCVRGIDRRTGEPKELLPERFHKLKTSAQTKRPSVPNKPKTKKTKIQGQTNALNELPNV